MSKIQQELSAATGVSKKRGQDDQEFFKALAKAASELPDAAWNRLSNEAQDWFNDAADQMNTKKEIANFPDAEDAEDAEPEAPTATRRRGAAKEEPVATGAKVGDVVTILTKRKTTVTGKIIELDDEVVVVDSDGKDVEIARDRIESMKLAGAKPGRRKSADDEPEVPAVAEPKVGDQITAVTARDKEYSGKVIEVEDDSVVIEDSAGDEVELVPSKLKSLIVTSPPATPSRRKSADADDVPPATRQKRTSARDNGGVSATVRMRELIVDDMNAKVEDIGKALTKEGIQFRDNTLNLVYADTHKLLKILKDKKLIK